MPYWSTLPFDAGFLSFLSAVLFGLSIIIHIASFQAIGGWLEEFPGEGVLLNDGMWKLVGLVFGLLGLLAFWAIHISSIRGNGPPPLP